MTITEALAQLEQAIKQSPQLSYEEAYQLWREAERITGLVEHHMFSAPDYPETCDLCGKLGATEQADGAVLCEGCANTEISNPVVSADVFNEDVRDTI